MRHVLSIVIGAWILSAARAEAFTYEVLFDDTLAHDAVSLGRATRFDVSMQSVLLDGKVKTKGTEAETYDRLIVNSLKAMGQFAFNPNASVRFTLPLLGTFEKKEGKQIPRMISESSWLEARPKLEMIFATQNNLDIILGLNLHTISGYKVESDTENFQATDRYSSLSMSYPHLVIVKHGGRFDGGFSFQSDAQKSRTVSKSTSLDETQLEFEDKVYSPTTIAIFASLHPSFGDVYAEFAAVEASGGGNRIDSGIAVREDYFRTMLGGMFPLGGKDLQLESNLLYKSLSYADNRNVSLDTIPTLALHLKLHVNYLVPAYLGLIGVQGSDGQSLQEFNADYHLSGVGFVAGMNMFF